MSLAIGIYNEMRRIGAALAAAIAGVDGKVTTAGSHVDAVGDLVTSVGNAVATLQNTANTISTKVTAINDAGGTKGIKSIQRGMVSFGSEGAINATITAVVPSKTELRLLGWRGSGAASQTNGVTLVLTNATTVTVIRNGNYGPIDAAWELTEWN